MAKSLIWLTFCVSVSLPGQFISLSRLILVADDSRVSGFSLGRQGNFLIIHPKLIPTAASNIHPNQKSTSFFPPESQISTDKIVICDFKVKKASFFIMT